METYKNVGGHSGIQLFEIAAEHIDIEWKNGKRYRYDYSKPGAIHVEKMKQLAAEGKSLATYVNQHVRNNFAVQLK